MTKQEIREKVNDLVIDKLGVKDEEVLEESNLETDLGADSLDVMEIVIDAEKAFDVFISEEETEGIRTMGDIYQLVEEKVKK